MNYTKVRVLSLGAGVQSSTLAILCEKGIIEKPDFAIFADTQAEPKAVYDYLQYLKGILSFPVHVITHGDIVDDMLKSQFVSAPLYVLHADGSKGIGKRQCTADYKIKPINKAVRRILGYKKNQRIKHEVEMLIGISVDEIQRMKTSPEKWVTNRYPLIEQMNFTRQDCIEFMEKNNIKKPPRSACYICPYRNDLEWHILKNDYPNEWEKAVDFDEKIRSIKTGMKGKQYLHKSCKPLKDVVLNPLFENKQLGIFSGMQNECEGMCGI